MRKLTPSLKTGARLGALIDGTDEAENSTLVGSNPESTPPDFTLSKTCVTIAVRRPPTASGVGLRSPRDEISSPQPNVPRITRYFEWYSSNYIAHRSSLVHAQPRPLAQRRITSQTLGYRAPSFAQLFFFASF